MCDLSKHSKIRYTIQFDILIENSLYPLFQLLSNPVALVGSDPYQYIFHMNHILSQSMLIFFLLTIMYLAWLFHINSVYILLSSYPPPVTNIIYFWLLEE